MGQVEDKAKRNTQLHQIAEDIWADKTAAYLCITVSKDGKNSLLMGGNPALLFKPVDAAREEIANDMAKFIDAAITFQGAPSDESILAMAIQMIRERPSFFEQSEADLLRATRTAKNLSPAIEEIYKKVYSVGNKIINERKNTKANAAK